MWLRSFSQPFESSRHRVWYQESYRRTAQLSGPHQSGAWNDEGQSGKAIATRDRSPESDL